MSACESFVFYRSFRDAIFEMSDKDQLATLLAICDYALYGLEPQLESAMARAIFTVARPSIDANKGRRVNGAKGGRPRKNTTGSDEKTDGLELENQWFSKTESTEAESETESETETETGAKAAPPEALPTHPEKPKRKSYGQFGWVKLSDEEYSRLSNDFGEIEVKRCISYVDEAAQLTGNKNKWRDWNLVLRRCHRDGWGLLTGQKPTAEQPKSRTGRIVTDPDGKERVIFDE